MRVEIVVEWERGDGHVVDVDEVVTNVVELIIDHLDGTPGIVDLSVSTTTFATRAYVDAADEAGLARFRAYSRERAAAVAAEGGTVPDDSLDARDPSPEALAASMAVVREKMRNRKPEECQMCGRAFRGDHPGFYEEGWWCSSECGYRAEHCDGAGRLPTDP